MLWDFSLGCEDIRIKRMILTEDLFHLEIIYRRE